jgi:hypothetical protein
MKKALLLGLLLAAGQAFASAPEMKFCSGQPGGYYEKLASEVGRNITKGTGGELEVLNTGGSVENAEMMQERECDIALIQADVAAGMSLRDVKVVDAHTEIVYWLHGKNGVKDFGDMEDDATAKKYAMATVKGSGASVTMTNWVKTDKDYEGVRIVELDDWAEAAEAVAQGYVVRAGVRYEIAGMLYIGRGISTDITEDFGTQLFVGEVDDNSFEDAKDLNNNPLYTHCSVTKAQRAGLPASTTFDPGTYCLKAQVVFNNDYLAQLDTKEARKVRKAVAKGINSTVKLVR